MKSKQIMKGQTLISYMLRNIREKYTIEFFLLTKKQNILFFRATRALSNKKVNFIRLCFWHTNETINGCEVDTCQTEIEHYL